MVLRVKNIPLEAHYTDEQLAHMIAKRVTNPIPSKGLKVVVQDYQDSLDGPSVYDEC